MAQDNEQSEEGFVSRMMKQLFGDSGKEVLPGNREGQTDTPVEAADDLTLRKEWRRKKIEAMSRGEDFPSFSEYRAQRQGGQ